MKISISVPDDLWESVASPGASPSQTVQEALKQVARMRATSEERVSGASQRLLDQLTAYDDADPLAELVEGAHDLQTKGYAIGVELGKSLPWVDLEALPSGTDLRAGLFAAMDDQSVSAALEDVRDRLWQAVEEWEVELATNQFGEPTPSRLLCEAIASGLDDLRDAVVTRIHGGAASGGDQ